MTFRESLFQIRKIQFFKEKKFLFLLFLSLSLNLFLWLYIYFNFHHTRGNIILLRDFFLGVISIVHWIYLLRIPLNGLIIFIINFILGFKLYLQQKKNLTGLLFYISLIVQIILLTTVILI